MSIRIAIATFMLSILTACACPASTTAIPLDGPYKARLGSADTLYDVKLPGTLNENKVGEPLKKSAHGCLSARYNYMGECTYTRDFEVPATLADKNLELVLERVMWKSEALIDGKKIDQPQTSLATPHIFFVGKLAPGKHSLTLKIDNRQVVRIGEKGHAYGEHMQTIWNGVLGEMTLREVPAICNVFIETTHNSLKVTLKDVASTANAPQYNAELIDLQTQKVVFTAPFNEKIFTRNFKGEVKPWDEFTPNLYLFKIVDPENGKEIYSKRIGFRSFERKGNKLFLNGKPLFLRGNLDNCHFPLSGAPSMDKAEWMRIMKIQKDNGCNNIRFHSWCPPKVAFDVADELGLYLAPEANMWIDGWMPASSFDGQKYIGLGKGDAALDAYVKREWNAIQDVYGNSPSFAMMCVGNELGNTDFNLLNQWQEERKAWDTRHLYSASTARAITKTDDYFVSHAYPGCNGLIRQEMHPHTNWSYEYKYHRMVLPVVAHEIGQWPVYPLWSEIDQYTGTLRAWNLENFRDQAKAKNVFQFNKEFNLASGMQNKLMYKDEIESFMRTPSTAGIHLLGIQDYSGQGEAIIGWLNSFYENKGYLSEKEVAGFFAPTVILAGFPKYVYAPGETYTADLTLHHYAQGDFEPDAIQWKIVAPGKTIAQGTVEVGAQPNGSVCKVGTIKVPLDAQNIGRFTLVCNSQKGQFAENSWPLWVLPDAQTQKAQIANWADVEKNVVCTDDPNEALEKLQAGKTVILEAAKLGNKGCFNGTRWGSVYWSTSWFPGQSGTSLGTWYDPDFAPFKNFGAAGYADWCWWKIIAGGRTFRLDDLPSFRPFAMNVPDFHENRRIGAIFTLKVGQGNLLVCGYNLNQNLHEAQYLKNELMAYAHNQFKPQAEATPEWIQKTFAKAQIKLLPRPTQFKNATVYIECAKKLDVENSDVKQNAKFDRIETTDNVKVETQNVTLWRDNTGTYWVMRDNANVRIKFPAGNTGKLYLRFRDGNKLGRAGEVTFEGRKFAIPEHKNKPNASYELVIEVDREDSLDGVIEFKTQTTKGPNLQLDRIIYQPNAS